MTGERDIPVSRSVTIPADEIRYTFTTSGGPGGQHANRSATRVTLTWNVLESKVLGPRQLQRIRSGLRSRIDNAGEIRLSSDRFRSQLRNREDVTRRLAELVAAALRPKKKRTATAPTRAARERRLQQKKRRSEIKRARRPPGLDA